MAKKKATSVDKVKGANTMTNNIRYYYTLNEIFEGSFDVNLLQQIADDEVINAPDFNEKFNAVVYSFAQMYDDWYIGYVDKFIRLGIPPIEPTEEEINKIKINFVKKVVYTYNFTSDRYLTLLDLYETQKRNLMSKLSNTSSNSTTHRVNDTPQNGGNFYDDEHTSVYEQTTISTNNTIDPTTVMSRLNEIQDKYANVIKDWVEEFNSLFIPPYNEWSCNE